MKVITVYNPDNLPLDRVLVYGTRGIVIPKDACVLLNEETHYRKVEPIPHILLYEKEYKWCGCCHKWIRICEYYKNHALCDGLHYICADCTIAATKKWYTKTKYKKYGKVI
jgi:hypothetical protein